MHTHSLHGQCYMNDAGPKMSSWHKYSVTHQLAITICIMGLEECITSCITPHTIFMERAECEHCSTTSEGTKLLLVAQKPGYIWVSIQILSFWQLAA